MCGINKKCSLFAIIGGLIFILGLIISFLFLINDNSFVHDKIREWKIATDEGHATSKMSESFDNFLWWLANLRTGNLSTYVEHKNF